MVETTIKTNESGMFLTRERIEEYFLMKGQVAQIEALARKAYSKSTTKEYAAVDVAALEEILQFKCNAPVLDIPIFLSRGEVQKDE